MNKEDKDRLILITRGENLYRQFCTLLYDNLNGKDLSIMTPNTEILKRMGKYQSINSKGFIQIALNELLTNNLVCGRCGGHLQ